MVFYWPKGRWQFKCDGFYVSIIKKVNLKRKPPLINQNQIVNVKVTQNVSDFRKRYVFISSTHGENIERGYLRLMLLLQCLISQ